MSKLVRIGLPLVILIFYVSAALEFGYTPDNAFTLIRAARDIVDGAGGFAAGSVSPLWVALLAAAGWGHLDPVLAAKVLSLLFACTAVALAYLIAHEVTVDRVIAFCAALAVAMQYWLLQTAPSGTPLALALALSLACVFFLLRNDYLLAAVLTGLLAMVFWQAVAFLAVILLDVLLNAVSRRRALQVALASLLVFFAVQLPWILFASVNRLDLLPRIGGPGDLPVPSTPVAVMLLLLVLLAASNFLPGVRRREGEGGFGRAHVPVFLWMAILATLGLTAGGDHAFLLLPLLTVYAMSGLRNLAGLGKWGMGYTAVFVLTAVVLLVDQMAYNGLSKPRMARAREESTDLAMIGVWIKGSLPDSAHVDGVHPQLLQYYSRHRVDALGAGPEEAAQFVVCAADSMPGFVQAYRPRRDSPRIESSRFAVWKRSH